MHDLSQDSLEIVNKAPVRSWAFLAMTERCPLAEKAMSEGYARLRFRDTSLLVWQQQQLELEKGPPTSYLSRSQSSCYSQYGNQAVVVRDKTRLKDSDSTGQSRICAVMWSWYSSHDWWYASHIFVKSTVLWSVHISLFRKYGARAYNEIYEQCIKQYLEHVCSVDGGPLPVY